MVTSSRIPTRIVDKNGRATVVYKALSSDVPDSRSNGIPPVASTPRLRTSSLLNVPPLSSGEVEEFLAFYPESVAGTHAIYRSLSAQTKGILWWAQQQKVISEEALNVLLTFAKGDIQKNDLEDHSIRQADNIIRSTVLVTELVSADHPVINSAGSSLIYDIREMVVGCGYRGEKVPSKPPVFSTVEEMLPVVGICSYAVAAAQHEPSNKPSRYYDVRFYADEEGLGYAGGVLSNPVLETYVKAHPDDGYVLGKYVAERGLGESEDDAKVALEYLAETKGTRAVSDGWL